MSTSHRRSERTRSHDPRSGLVLDTRSLGRRAGAMSVVEETVPAPADLGIDVIAVPQGSPVELDLRLEAVVEGVLVTGTAFMTAVGECVRCLGPVTVPLEVDVQELFVHDGAEGDEEGFEDEVSRLDGDLVDLEPVLRDDVVLELPFRPLCTPDCPGLCPECGARLADDPTHGHELALDPRWEALRGLDDDADVVRTSDTYNEPGSEQGQEMSR